MEDEVCACEIEQNPADRVAKAVLGALAGLAATMAVERAYNALVIARRNH